MIRCFLMMMLFAAPVLAADPSGIPPSPIVKTELVADVPAERRAQDGGRDLLGVRFTIPEGWHIYWQNPGDSGIPTTITWHLPPGVTANGLEWPLPEVVTTEGLTNYGYGHEMVLASSFQGLREHVPGNVSAEVKWLVCKDICIPESAKFDIALPAKTANAAQHFAAAEAKQPWGTDSVIAAYSVAGDKVTFHISAAFGDDAAPRHLRWIPIDDGIIQNNAAQAVSLSAAEGSYITATITTAKGSMPAVEAYRGLLVFENAKGKQGIYITARPDTMVAVEGADEPIVQDVPAAASAPLLQVLLLAFLGGLILNIMPCVLPILALKALAVAKKADVSRRAAARQGVAYSIGVIGSFLAIAGVMLALKSAGESVGWGFQLQQPLFVAAMAGVMVLVALNLLGWFELPVLFGARATGVDDSTVRGSLFTGMLAVLVATPCTAPFMATAIGATLALPPALSLLVFASLGAGMAAPFLLISVWPPLRRLLPKPGKWMHWFKQALAIPMLATALWLGWVFWQLQHPSGPMRTAHEVFSDTRLSELVADGTPVLVDATADWCLTCKVNERVAITTPEMQAFLAEHKVVLMVADWTANDPAITQYLAKFGRAGVPLYVYYPPGAAPKVLPQLLTPAIVRGAIAGASAN